MLNGWRAPFTQAGVSPESRNDPGLSTVEPTNGEKADPLHGVVCAGELLYPALAAPGPAPKIRKMGL